MVLKRGETGSDVNFRKIKKLKEIQGDGQVEEEVFKMCSI